MKLQHTLQTAPHCEWPYSSHTCAWLGFLARNQIGSVEIINIINNGTLQGNNAYNERECVQDKKLRLAVHCKDCEDSGMATTPH